LTLSEETTMGVLDKIELAAGETKIDTWTILYEPPKGGKYNGKLLVTNQRLLYDAQFDMSVSGILEEALFVKWGSEGFLAIPKSRIASVETKKGFLAKRVIVVLDNGDKHTFNYGMLSIDKVLAAIQQR
jgi:hypothetical protein